MNSFFMKIIEQSGEKLVAACDKEVVGLELFSHGVRIKVNQTFYGNELVHEKELLDAVNTCTSANVIGIKIVDILVKNRLIHEEAILWIEHPSEKSKKIGHAILIR